MCLDQEESLAPGRGPWKPGDWGQHTRQQEALLPGQTSEKQAACVEMASPWKGQLLPNVLVNPAGHNRKNVPFFAKGMRKQLHLHLLA